MLVIGLPLICLLTFQLVKDMAVYEMGVALAPASQLLKQAYGRGSQNLPAQRRAGGHRPEESGPRRKLADLAARKAKAKADLGGVPQAQ